MLETLRLYARVPTLSETVSLKYQDASASNKPQLKPKIDSCMTLYGSRNHCQWPGFRLSLNRSYLQKWSLLPPAFRNNQSTVQVGAARHQQARHCQRAKLLGRHEWWFSVHGCRDLSHLHWILCAHGLGHAPNAGSKVRSAQRGDSARRS